MHQEDPRLTAYLLGELSEEEAQAVEHAVAGDLALGLTLAEAEKTQAQLRGIFGGNKEELLPHQCQKIRRAAKEAARNGKIENLRSHRNVRRVWMAPLAAAVIGAGIFILTKIPATKSGGVKPVTIHTGEAPLPLDSSMHNGGAVMNLPLRVGRGGLAKISNTIRVAGKLPAADEVSIPEMLNAFPLKPGGAAAIKSGCSLGAEILPCPWKPSGSLIFLGVRGANDGEQKLSVGYEADRDSVIDYRIIGYLTGSGGKAKDTAMPMNSSMILMIEIESKTPTLGKIVWKVNGEAEPEIPLVRDPEREPSDDARFAALVCGFGIWLKGEDRASIDDTLVLGMAREVAADGMVADRYDFLQLVDQAIKLAGE